jgi:hypothetical protein
MVDQPTPQAKPDVPAAAEDPPGMAETAGKAPGAKPGAPPAAEQPAGVPAPTGKPPEAKPNVPAPVDDPPGMAQGILQKEGDGGPNANRLEEDIEGLTFAAELADEQEGWPPKAKP